LANRDPADRFLLATAKVFELTLVTADEHLLKSRDVSLLANRLRQIRPSLNSTKQLQFVNKTLVAISFTLTRTRGRVKLSGLQIGHPSERSRLKIEIEDRRPKRNYEPQSRNRRRGCIGLESRAP
jgi:hypothetical protein